ncbi:homoserine O-acetyltransferase/O-succinyltransferase family protein [Parasphingorhabdus litoris]
MDWAQTKKHSTFDVCWGGMAIIYHFHGLQKYLPGRTQFGCYRHMNWTERKSNDALPGF